MPLCFAVIRAKVVSEKEVDSGNDIYGNPIKRIQYEIKQIKVKGDRRRAAPLGRASGGLGVRLGPPEDGDRAEVSCCLWVPLDPWTKSSHPWNRQ